MMASLLVLFVQEGGDIRSVSWWLDRAAAAIGVNRELFWTIVVTLNFLVLVWILYRALFKGRDFSLPGALHARGVSIAAEIQGAAEAARAAEVRLAQIEARIANLPAELAALERQAQQEADAEHARLLREAEAEAARIAQAARQEIDSAAALAQKQLQAFAAALALDLAEQRLRERMSPELDRRLVAAGLDAIAHPSPNGASHAGH